MVIDNFFLLINLTFTLSDFQDIYSNGVKIESWC